LNRATGHRIKYLKVDADTGEEVANEDIVKGFKGRHARPRQAHREPEVGPVRARQVRDLYENSPRRSHQPEARRQADHAEGEAGRRQCRRPDGCAEAESQRRWHEAPRPYAGPSQLAGELCSPYVFSTSWQNDQTPAAMGRYMNQKG
ncbi:hypothetical protein KXV85_005287, partial [Aspergillus fumigatus]